MALLWLVVKALVLLVAGCVFCSPVHIIRVYVSMSIWEPVLVGVRVVGQGAGSEYIMPGAASVQCRHNQSPIRSDCLPIHQWMASSAHVINVLACVRVDGHLRVCVFARERMVWCGSFPFPPSSPLQWIGGGWGVDISLSDCF